MLCLCVCVCVYVCVYLCVCVLCLSVCVCVYLCMYDVCIKNIHTQVLQILPSVWPISTVKAFLMHSLRSSIDTSRTVKIEKNLAKGENLQVRGWGYRMGGAK